MNNSDNFTSAVIPIPLHLFIINIIYIHDFSRGSTKLEMISLL